MSDDAPETPLSNSTFALSESEARGAAVGSPVEQFVDPPLSEPESDEVSGESSVPFVQPDGRSVNVSSLPDKGPVDTAGVVVGSEPLVVDGAPVSVDVVPGATEVVDAAIGTGPPAAFTAFDDGTPHADPASTIPITAIAAAPPRLPPGPSPHAHATTVAPRRGPNRSLRVRDRLLGNHVMDTQWVSRRDRQASSSSTARRSASVRSHSIDAALAATCSGLVAPAITLATPGCPASHDIASSSGV